MRFRNRASTVGVAIVDPEQKSLFGGGSVVAVSRSQGCAVFAEDAAFCQLAALGRLRQLRRARCKGGACIASIPPTTPLPALVDDAQLMSMRAFDLGLAGYVLNSSVSEYTYDVLLDTYMGRRAARGENRRAARCRAGRGRARPGRSAHPRP